MQKLHNVKSIGNIIMLNLLEKLQTQIKNNTNWPKKYYETIFADNMIITNIVQMGCYFINLSDFYFIVEVENDKVIKFLDEASYKMLIDFNPNSGIIYEKISNMKENIFDWSEEDYFYFNMKYC